MKIKRFNINEQVEPKRCHVFTDYSSEDAEQPDFYIFENEEAAFNYLANRLYPIYQDYDLDLNILDECEDAVELIEQYEEDINDRTIDKQLIFYTPTSLSDYIKLQDWIKLRRDAKKYNL